MGAWIGPAIGAGASLIGNLMSQSGQSATNVMSMQNMLQQEQWQEQMSDTAMQRRVADLRAAGLNPLLATGTSGAQVGSVGQPSLQNPAAAWGQLGSQVTNAGALATQNAQVNQLEAQADKARMDAANSAAQLPYTGDTAKAMLEQIGSKTNEINQEAWRIAKQYDLTVENVVGKIQDNEVQRELIPLQVKMQQLDYQRALLGMPKLANDATWQKAHPELSGWLQSGAAPQAGGMVTSGVKAASEFLPSKVLHGSFVP